MKAREGDYIEDANGIIFDVKGLVHPPGKVVAFPRFIPEQQGTRKHNNKFYNKIYSLYTRFEFLKENFPNYLVYDKVFNTQLCEVPVKQIKYHYKPNEHLQKLRNQKELDSTEKIALKFMETLKKNADVPWSKLGVSGSVMANLHEPSSDIDLIVYGSKTGYKVQAAMKKIFEDKESPIKAYDIKGLKELFDFRSKDTNVSFEDFVRTDSRKISHGTFMGKHFFIRFVKDFEEITEQYGSIIYKPEGNSKIRATVVNDSESLFTPCSYKLANVQILDGPKVEAIKEIVSFRGRFCEHAKIGESVIAEGKLERLQQHGKDDHFRLLLGSKPSDHMILI